MSGIGFGLTQLIREIDAFMINVEPWLSREYAFHVWQKILYWMASYLEVTADTAGLSYATKTVVLDMPHGTAFGWNMLVKAAGLDQ